MKNRKRILTSLFVDMKRSKMIAKLCKFTLVCLILGFIFFPAQITQAAILLPAPSLNAPNNEEINVSTTPNFSWSTVSGANYYWLTVATNQSYLPIDPYASSAPNCIIGGNGVGIPNTSYAPASGVLSPETTYYWRVQAYHGSDVSHPDQQGQYSEIRSFTTAQIFLPAPTLTAPANGATGVSTTTSFTWSVVSGATSYRILVGTTSSGLPTDPTVDSGSNLVINDTPTGTSYTPASGVLSMDTTYYWEVHARSPTQYGTWSSKFSFTTVSPPALPPPPTHVAPSNGATGQSNTPTIQWNSVSGADYYGLYIRDITSSEGPLVFDSEVNYGPISGTSFDLPSGYLNNGKTYRWNMRSHNGAGWGTSFSNGWTFSTQPPPESPIKPMPISPGEALGSSHTPILHTSVTFTWNKNNTGATYSLYVRDITGYDDFVGTDVGMLVINGLNVGDTDSCVWSGAAAERKYRWQVEAVKGSITALSDRLVFLTQPLSQTTTTKGIDLRDDIDWSQVYNAGYRFAFVKATEGIDWSKPGFEGRVDSAQQAGLLAGVFHFALPIDKDGNPLNKAEDEAESFVRLAGDYIQAGYIRPVLDVEDTNHPNLGELHPELLGKEALARWIKVWMDSVKVRTGIEPILYMNGYLFQFLSDSSIVNQYDIWIVDLRDTEPIAGDMPNTRGWNTWVFWQYKHDVNLANGTADLDLFNGDMNDLQAFVIDIVNNPYPIVESFTVEPASIILDEQFNISYAVSTTGSGLKQVELWRTTDIDGDSDPDWSEDPQGYIDVHILSGQSSYSGVFYDSPPSEGTYWYGIHVVNNNGSWNDEQNSNTGNSPGDFGPAIVEVESGNNNVVFFPDPNLEAVIRQAINKTTGDIHESDLENLTILDARNMNISDLTGLKYCVNLTSLNLSVNDIHDISELENLSNLMRLELGWNNINNISALQNLTNLTLLELSGSNIDDISFLENFTNLTDLFLGWNDISNISVFEHLTNLKYIHLSDNNISDISVLENLTNLTNIYLDNNNINNISSLANITYIGTGNSWHQREEIKIHIGLSNNLITDISPLVQNQGIDKDDGIDLRGNPLNNDSLNTYISELEERGVKLLYDTVPGDTTPPAVTTVMPQDGAADIKVDTVITATFSEAMDESTITANSFTLTGSTVSGKVTYDPAAYTATFTPDVDLKYGHQYTATLSADITDEAGNPLTGTYTWTFITQLAPESEQPQLKAPWEGIAKISQGNNAPQGDPDYSHYVYDGWENSYAIDIALQVGTDVLAPADGIVWDTIFTYPEIVKSGGIELIIQHTGPTGKNFYTVYLHLSKILVTKGNSVIQGQIIAKSGNTGNVDAHLHFHMWKPKGSEPEWKYDSHTMPIERLVMKQVGVDNDFREYNARKGELDNSQIAERFFESNNATLKNELPVADAGPDQSISSGDIVWFDSSNSLDSDGTIVSYQWDFGDGENAEGKIVNHRFRGTTNESKNYVVTLVVEDDSGATSTDSCNIDVTPLEKTVEVTHESNIPIPGQPVFTRMTVSYNWIHDDIYVVSRIQYESGGFIGVSTISIWDFHSYAIPIPRWATDIFSFGVESEETYFPILEEIHYGGDIFKGIEVDAYDAMNIYIAGWAGISISEGPSLPVPFFETNSTCFQSDYTEAPDVPIETQNLELAHLCSPGELRVYDSQNRVTGLVNGEVKEDIPDSTYDEESRIVFILYPSDTYRYEVAGTDNGTYGLDISFIEAGEVVAFATTEVPITTGATYEYTLNWDALSQGEEGITIKVDSDGDGVFEQEIATAPPFTPNVLSPSNNATRTSINIPLIWTGGDPDDGDKVTYKVYLGAKEDPPLVSSNLTGNTYTPSTLDYDTTYFWRVVARDNHGISNQGPIWSFTTASTPLPTPSPTSPPAGGGGGGGGGGSGVNGKTITSLRGSTSSTGVAWANIQSVSMDTKCTLDIPYGTKCNNANGYALSSITITQIAEPDPAQTGVTIVGTVYELGPGGASFEPAITLTIKYDETALPASTPESSLSIAVWDAESKTYKTIDCKVDVVANKITASISHFSRYTIIAVPIVITPPAPTSTSTPSLKPTSPLTSTPAPASSPTLSPTTRPVATPTPSTPAVSTPTTATTTPVAALPIEKSTTNWWLYVGIIIGAIIVAGLLVFVIISHRRDKH